MLCFIGCTITFFLEPVLRHASSDARLVNTAVMFGGIIFARLGHINFDLAQVRIKRASFSSLSAALRLRWLSLTCQEVTVVIRQRCEH